MAGEGVESTATKWPNYNIFTYRCSHWTDGAKEMHAKFQKVAMLIAAFAVVVIIVGLVIHYGMIIAKERLPKEAEVGAISNRTNEFSFIPPKGETWEILLAARNPSVLTQNLTGVVQVLSDNEPPRTISFKQEELQEAQLAFSAWAFFAYCHVEIQ